MLDVRKPIGYLFIVVGVVLAVYGFVQPQYTTLDFVGSTESVVLNLDLPWGLLMLLFGALMLVLARRVPAGDR